MPGLPAPGFPSRQIPRSPDPQILRSQDRKIPSCLPVRPIIKGCAMYVSAIIAAGGRGRRLGAGVPKQLLGLGGRPMLQWSLDTFTACERVNEVIVVVP